MHRPPYTTLHERKTKMEPMNTPGKLTPEPKPAYEDAYDWRKPAHESSQIDALAWDYEKDQMMARFKTYWFLFMLVYDAYPNATVDEMETLLAADSVDAAFNAWKKGESAKDYRTQNISPGQVSARAHPRSDRGGRKG